MNVLVTGASGLVGTALCDALRRDGASVKRLVRCAPRAADEARWDPDAGEIDAAALEGLDGVVHLAGENIAGGRWTSARKKRIEQSRVRGTHLLATALAATDAKPGCLVSASATGIYGHRVGDEWVDAESLPGSGFLADVCRRWEEAADPARTADIRTVHPRIGVVLARDGGALKKMLPPFRLGLGGPMGNGRQFMSWIQIDDLVDVLRHALENPALSGPVDAVAPHPVTNAEFSRTLGKVLRRPAVFRMPKKVAQLVFGELADELLLASTRVRPTALLRADYDFRYPELEQALEHTLAR